MTEIYLEDQEFNSTSFDKSFTHKIAALNVNPILDEINLINPASTSINSANDFHQYSEFGAYGVLKMTSDVSKLTQAGCFQKNIETPLVVKFTGHSISLPFQLNHHFSHISAKLYTSQGNLDLNAHDTSIFLLTEPGYNLTQTSNIESKLIEMDEDRRSLNWSTILAKPSLMQYYFHKFSLSLNSFPFRNKSQISKTLILSNSQNHISLARIFLDYTQEDAHQLYSQYDLTADEYFKRSIESQLPPKWIVKIQVISEDKFDQIDFNPFDSFCFWPLDQFPIENIGNLELQQLSENFDAEIKGLDFNSSCSIKGISCNRHILEDTIFNSNANATTLELKNCQHYYQYFLNATERQNLAFEIANGLKECSDEVCEGILILLNTIHPDLESNVRRALVKL